MNICVRRTRGKQVEEIDRHIRLHKYQEIIRYKLKESEGHVFVQWSQSNKRPLVNFRYKLASQYGGLEVPVSEIRDWTYTLINLFGYGNVMSFRDKAMENPLNERAVLLLACEGEVLRNHAAVSDRVTAWRNNVAVVPSHAPPIHPFDLQRRVFSFLNDEPYTPGEPPDDAPTLDAREYES
ncbi:hypothetical protein EV421DRAFT_1910235 [Armillaria borealis]|uniref:Uncharacterized protein n=1 Tax=Armillaria borealis TaxID=47425 RepID=A0AA39J1S3_9AGAR|nr:hypothetical protein EV421DRAFT_1910235 [Armillaria borealis]